MCHIKPQSTGHQRGQVLRLYPTDDMAVALRDFKAGETVEAGDIRLHLRTPVPAKHKVYLRDLPKGVSPKLYDMPVGRTTRAVRAGEVVSRENLAPLMGGEGDLFVDIAPWKPPDLSGLPTTFVGYRRPDGRIGTRNHLLVVHTVICARHLAERVVSVARRGFGFEDEDPWIDYTRQGRMPSEGISKGFTGVDEIALLQHESGCTIAEQGDREALLRFMSGYIHHPNVAGALVLGLGCEKASIQALRSVVGETWKPVVYLSHQDHGEEASLLRFALDAIKGMLPEIARHERVELPASSLVLGLECGGSDGFSGISANPALGQVSGRIVAQGGAVILGETPEMFGAEQLLAARAVNPQVARQILKLVENYREYAIRSGTHLIENLSAGNLREGLTTIQIKSLGAIQKAGNAPISGVLEYTTPIPGPGLFLLDTPGYDVPSTSALAASGANLIVFTTGMGTPVGNPIVPVIKVTSNREMARRMSDIIDFDAGGILEGEPLEEAGRRLYRLVLEVASGHWTANECLGHRESAFWRRQAML
jgi:altronate hydrolase